MITFEGEKVEHFIWGLTPPIQGNVIAANPSTFDSAKHLAQSCTTMGITRARRPPTPVSTTPTPIRPYIGTLPNVINSIYTTVAHAETYSAPIAIEKGTPLGIADLSHNKTTNLTIPGQVRHVTGAERPVIIKGPAPRKTTEMQEEPIES